MTMYFTVDLRPAVSRFERGHRGTALADDAERARRRSTTRHQILLRCHHGRFDSMGGCVPADGELVTVDGRGPVLVVTIEREAKRNAINAEVAAGIDAALNRLEDDPELRVGVLTGGPRMFCAGTDLAQTAGPPTPRGGEYGVIRRTRTKPLIAAVEGFALGGGMEVVLACDLVVASRTSRFGLPEIQKALVPTCGGMFRTARALPLNIAHEMVFTGEPLGAERAYAVGFVNHLTDEGGALDGALELAARICANGPLALRQTKAVIAAVTAADDVAAWALSDAATAVISKSEDAREGRDAFLERRAPVWRGR
jgi:enoyl-CoA hydratase